MIKRKTAVIVTAFVLLLGCFVGGTVAYLISSTGTITNTFTVGNVHINLTETKPGDTSATDITSANSFAFHGVPGQEFKKDPKVTVLANSEDCYLFIKVKDLTDNTVNSKQILIYTLNLTNNGWTLLEGHNDVYYREVSKASIDTSFELINDNKVTINSELTVGDVDLINKTEGGISLNIAFTAGAVQKTGFTSAANAYSQLSW